MESLGWRRSTNGQPLKHLKPSQTHCVVHTKLWRFDFAIGRLASGSPACQWTPAKSQILEENYYKLFIQLTAYQQHWTKQIYNLQIPPPPKSIHRSDIHGRLHRRYHVVVGVQQQRRQRGIPARPGGQENRFALHGFHLLRGQAHSMAEPALSVWRSAALSPAPGVLN